MNYINNNCEPLLQASPRQCCKQDPYGHNRHVRKHDANMTPSANMTLT